MNIDRLFVACQSLLLFPVLPCHWVITSSSRSLLRDLMFTLYRWVQIQITLLFPRETNSMVEEFMLLANISVAQKIYDEFSECALLRKHPAPPPSNYDILNKAAKSKVHLRIQTSASKTSLMTSIYSD